MKKTFEIVLGILACLAFNAVIFWMLCEWVMA
jgi:hypothetical protein